METPLILETSFLIDLQRFAARKKSGAAAKFLEHHSRCPLYITFTIAGELAAGISMRDRIRWEEFLSPFYVLPWNIDVSWHYGNVYRYLSENGMLIGANDLWIAATSLAYEIPVVTRNVRHFQRVPNLKLVRYAT
jgi:predicted nucleic acid-binding protein